MYQKMEPCIEKVDKMSIYRRKFMSEIKQVILEIATSNAFTWNLITTIKYTDY